MWRTFLERIPEDASLESFAAPQLDIGEAPREKKEAGEENYEHREWHKMTEIELKVAMRRMKHQKSKLKLESHKITNETKEAKEEKIKLFRAYKKSNAMIKLVSALLVKLNNAAMQSLEMQLFGGSQGTSK